MSDDGKTYEMNWDCKFCGQKKLLGKTHRYCPDCGAAQDPDKRYFPPDNEKVAVEDHQFVGADVKCTSCGEAQSAAAKNCTNCGAPMARGTGVAVKADQVVGADGQIVQPAAPPPPGAPATEEKKSHTGKIIGVVILLGIIGLFVVFLTWTKEAKLEVTDHTWTRAIAIEEYGAHKEEGPCTKMPKDAKELKRSAAKPECKTRKIDKGDGTFKEKKECTEPVEQCTYTVKKWAEVETVKETGRGIDSKLKWPKVKLGKQGKKGKKCDGCQREGPRTETYTVVFKDADGEELNCDFTDKSDWEKYKKASKWKGEQRVMGGGLDCSSLKAE